MHFKLFFTLFHLYYNSSQQASNIIIRSLDRVSIAYQVPAVHKSMKGSGSSIAISSDARQQPDVIREDLNSR
jgi:hypothetical protein